MLPIKDDFLVIPKDWDRHSEYTEIILAGDDWRLERIISCGQISPKDFWYEQSEDEWVMVIQGMGEIMWEDGSRCLLNKGEYVLIPKICKHRVSMTSVDLECIWLALFHK